MAAKWILLTGIILMLAVSLGSTDSGPLVASECFNSVGLKLELNCPADAVISIQWNDTFLGRSKPPCKPGTCCPQSGDCKIPVTEANHLALHLVELAVCEGVNNCSVGVVRIDHFGCSPQPNEPTDYENVTYTCVTIGTTSANGNGDDHIDVDNLETTTEDNSGGDRGGTTTDTSPENGSGGNSGGDKLETTTEDDSGGDSGGTTTDTTPENDSDGDSGNDSGGDNLVIIVAAIAGVLLLLIILAVVIFICYRRRRKAPEDRPTQVHDVEDGEVIKRPSGPDNIDRTYSHISRRSSSSYNVYEAVRLSTVSSSPGSYRPSTQRKPEPPPAREVQKPEPPPFRTLPEAHLNSEQTSSETAFTLEPASSHSPKSDIAVTQQTKTEGLTHGAFIKPWDTKASSKTESVIKDEQVDSKSESPHAESDDDDMTLTDNDLYHVIRDGGGEVEQASSVPDDEEEEEEKDEEEEEENEDDNDDDMVLTDNDLYNATDVEADVDEVKASGDEEVKRGSSPEQTIPEIDDSDTDMVVMDNDLYNTYSST